MSSALYQSDRRWAGLLLGNGPSKIGRAGCVLTSLTMAARLLGARPDLLPPHANTACLVAGAFTGDNLIVPLAAKALGLTADHDAILGLPGAAGLVDATRDALARGLALLRIDVSGDDRGDHTILGVRNVADGSVDCLCPAVGEVQLSPALSATVDWGHHNSEGKWIPDLRKYRVVGVRGVQRPAS